jgi:Na+-transporting methylmalonyl-CoA/oxaloacetate decarboxylase gamma subunit
MTDTRCCSKEFVNTTWEFMEFTFNHISFTNLFENGHNYITFSIMGMLIVFAGLSFISIYIAVLPKLLNLSKTIKAGTKKKKEGSGLGAVDTKNTELLLAIAVALHLDQTSGSDYEKITWKRHEDHESSWVTAGRMRGLAVRSHLPDRRN